jgi:hypothetical protein
MHPVMPMSPATEVGRRSRPNSQAAQSISVAADIDRVRGQQWQRHGLTA